MKQLSALCLILLLCHSLGAQTDTDFWFVAPDVSGANGELPLTLMLGSAGQPAIVTLDFPADPSFIPLEFTLAGLEIQIIDLSPWRSLLENSPANTVLNKGLHIVSTTPINIYYRVAPDNNTDVYNLKGIQALGTEFFIPAQTDFINVGGRSGFDIVATQDGTQVTITPAQSIVGHAAGIPFQVQLNRGQTFSCQEIGTGPDDHLAGSHIVADRPVAVSSTDESIVTSGTNGGRDLVGDQLIPVKLLGTAYIALRGEADVERVYITATADGTQVQVAGQNALLNQGDTQGFDLTGASTYISSNLPVYVWQLSGYGPEPGGAVLSPITCTGTSLVKYIRPASENFFVYLLTRTGNEGGFLLNGAPNIFPTAFSFVPGTGNQWKSARIEAFTAPVTSTNQIHNTQGLFHMSMVIYTSTGGAFSYFSDYSPLTLGELRTFCAGESLELDAGPDKTNYLWSTGDTTQTLSVQQPGTYWVSTQFGDCLLSDTVVVEMTDPRPNLGADTAICSNSVLTFSLDPGARYRWEDGSSSPVRTIDTSGTYWVTVSQNGCEATDTLRVSEISLPPLDLGPDTLLCAGESLLIDVSTPGATYRWQDGTNAALYAISGPGVYGLERSIGACTQSDTLIVGQRTLSLALGPDTLLCLGDTLRLDLAAEGVSYLWEDGTTLPYREITASTGLQVLATNRCESVQLSRAVAFEDCSCAPFVPNVFSPNADGVNDAFLIEFDCVLKAYSLQVFDRWGSLLFDSQQPGEGWPGTRARGNLLPAGVYFWVMQYEGEKGRNLGLQVVKGNVLLVK